MTTKYNALEEIIKGQTKTRLCIDCKHVIKNPRKLPIYTCNRPDLRSLVDGKSSTSCEVERKKEYNQGCGSSGRYFEASV